MKKFLLDTDICIHFLKGELDLLIGSSAIANGLIMVTKNSREFSRLSGLTIENWASGKK